MFDSLPLTAKAKRFATEAFAWIAACNIPCGSLLGIKLQVHATWVLLTLLFAWFSLEFCAIYVTMFVIVALHEFGHLYAAKLCGYQPVSITFYPNGGVALVRCGLDQRDWFRDFMFAAGGPLVNVLLILPLAVAAAYFDFWVYIAFLNLTLLVFNLIPAYPMDGGRMLASFLWYTLKDDVRAVQISVRVAEFFCVGMAFVAVTVPSPMLLLVAGFVYFLGRNELSRLKAARMEKDRFEARRFMDEMHARHSVRSTE